MASGCVVVVVVVTSDVVVCSVVVCAGSLTVVVVADTIDDEVEELDGLVSGENNSASVVGTRVVLWVEVGRRRAAKPSVVGELAVVARPAAVVSVRWVGLDDWLVVGVLRPWSAESSVSVEPDRPDATGTPSTFGPEGIEELLTGGDDSEPSSSCLIGSSAGANSSTASPPSISGSVAPLFVALPFEAVALPVEFWSVESPFDGSSELSPSGPEKSV